MNSHDWSAPIPPHPDGLTLTECPHATCVEPAGHLTAHSDGENGWRYAPPPIAFDVACPVWGCVRRPHDDVWHLLSSGSASGTHNAWEPRP